MRILHHKTRVGDAQVYFAELPPMTMRMSTDYGAGICIPMPWTYYTIRIKEYTWRDVGGTVTRPYGKVCCAVGRPSQWRRASNVFYYLPLPNLYPSSHTFCENGGQVPDVRPEEQIAKTINLFWEQGASYLCPWGQFGPIWRKFAEAAYKQPPTKLLKLTASQTGYDIVPRHPRSDTIQKLYGWWESLTPEEALQFPWGKKRIGNLEQITTNQYYGYEGFH